MPKLWGEQEINKAKHDKSLREKVKADMEEVVEIGKPRYYTIDSKEFWYKIGNRVATADAIRHFCDAIGDINPLYRDKQYADKSVLGRITAPPSFLFSVSMPNWKGVWDMTEYGYIISGFDAGDEVEWFRPIRINDEFRVQEIPIEIKDLTRENTALQFLNSANKIYTNQNDEIVAIIKSNIMKMVVSSKDVVSLKIPQSRHFSQSEIIDWLDLIENEEVRGDIPMFWEDVTEGDELPPTHHVFTLLESAVFQAVCSGISSWRFQIKKFGDDWKESVDQEGLPDLNSIHLTDESAQKKGSPRANCLAGQMQSWLCTMITNWMGDAGFLKKMKFQQRRPLYRGSLAICKGKVEKKYIEGDQHCVDLNIVLEDHNGDLPIPYGTATVILPSRKL